MIDLYPHPLVQQNGIFIEPENVQYFQEGGVQQLDGDYIPGLDKFSGANYFERESQFLHLVSWDIHEHRVKMWVCILPPKMNELSQ